MSFVPSSVAIVGATGKVGFATASALRQIGIPVKAIVRDVTKGTTLAELGCEIVVADILDSVALARAFDDVDAVQVIVPPRSSAPDGAQEMRDMIANLGKAIDLAQPKRVLGISDYGAHVSKDIGMPTLCRELEERLSRCGGNKIILRSAEHMQNLARGVTAAITSGTLHVFNDPITSRRPTISAHDLGLISANLLMRPGNQEGTEIFHAEGPRRYSAEDVAQSLGILLNRTVEVQAVPRVAWEGILQGAMSESLADLLVKANDAQNEGGLVDVEPGAAKPFQGTTELTDALRPFVL